MLWSPTVMAEVAMTETLTCGGRVPERGVTSAVVRARVSLFSFSVCALRKATALLKDLGKKTKNKMGKLNFPCSLFPKSFHFPFQANKQS